MRLVLIDDHRLFRDGLAAVLRSDPTLQIVGEAGDARSGEQLIRSTNPDLVVLDLALPGIGGLSLARELRRTAPSPRVLILSMIADEEHVAEALDEGVAGYASKEDSAEQVRAAIRTVAAGGTYLTPRVSRVVLDEYMRLRRGGALRQGPLRELTEREREVFELVVRGSSTAAIARQLGCSPRTIETHRSRIMRKLGGRSAADLVRFAAKNNLLPA